MINKLKRHYPNTVSEKTALESAHDYFWVSENGNSIGIPIKQLTVQEKRLLTMLFQSSDQAFNFNKSEQQLNWYQFFSQGKQLPITNWSKIRLIYFSISSSSFTHSDIEEAFLSFFSEDSLLIWENQNSGYIIENYSYEIVPFEELKEIISAFESDFFVKLFLFAGSFHEVNEELLFHNMMEKKCFTIGLQQLPNHRVHSIRTLFPHLLSNGIVSEKDWYIYEILGDTANDTEMIHTIKTYLTLNRNATLTAKQLFIHRNSLQYRIDKFTEKTDLDIKNFHDAMLVYICILLL
ncbi:MULTISPECIES: PucR family transcriptional regulator [Bacillus]|uniref:PucR family transcriptional regulator n=1 Tax=Bacillus TaxID=1386 RepID=UPI0002EA8AF0|nr:MULTISPECIES: helix-turn-helix domain-containing protein [Bacillus]